MDQEKIEKAEKYINAIEEDIERIKSIVSSLNDWVR